MWIAPGEARRLETDAVQEGACLAHGLVCADAMHGRGKGDAIFDGQAGVERSVAVLKHHLDLAAKCFERQLRCADGLALETDRTAGRHDQLHQQPRGG